MPNTTNVLYLAAEAEPFVKIGGLGDVAGALPLALRKLKPEIRGENLLDVRLVLPHHGVIRVDARPLSIFPLERNGIDVPVQISETSLDGMPVYLVGGGPIVSTGSVYSSNPIIDAEKYTFFSRAALELPRILNWKADVIHANDWHTSLALYGLLLKRWAGQLDGTVSVLTVHNLPYMGADVADLLASYGMTIAQSDLPDWARSLPLPLGLFSADSIVAVSPSYAQEILTPEFGCGLEDFLHRHRDLLTGILNGIDTDWYDPAQDVNIPYQFTKENPSIRVKNKIALQERVGLPVDSITPLIAMVGRMDIQKGVDLALKVLSRLTDIPWQFVLLGTGDPGLEEAARKLQAEYPGRVRVELKFDGGLARHIYAGSDMLLMPSRYEPCGLAQMIAMRYGCLPIVHVTGGLGDTVSESTGFRFRSATPRSLRTALVKALTVYSDREQWLSMQNNAMREDFSWVHSAEKYYNLYQNLLSKNTGKPKN
jgi:starch synthase